VIDPRHVGRRYGPYRYVVGLEDIRDFATAVSGGIPGRTLWVAEEQPRPWYVDEAAAASPQAIVAPPTFAARFAMQPFSAACADPALGIDVVKVLHGEQAFDFGDVVRPGDELETTGEIVGVRSKGALDFLTVRTATTNQRGKTVVVGTWTAVVRP
jgi:acyl dehydratase